MECFNPIAKKNKNHDGITFFRKELLIKIYKALKCKPEIDEKDQKLEIKKIEAELTKILGNDYYEWSILLIKKHNLTELGTEIFDSLLPLIPKDKDMLSTEIILHAIKPYENDESNDFASFGPIDPSNKFDWKLYKKSFPSKTKYGFILNTAGNEGSHWVSLFFNLKKNEEFTYFFDSLGGKPTAKVMERIYDIFELLYTYYPNVNQKVEITSKRKQFEGTECGVYAVHFIIQMIKGTKLIDFAKSDLSDSNISGYRKIYWKQS